MSAKPPPALTRSCLAATASVGLLAAAACGSSSSPSAANSSSPSTQSSSGSSSPASGPLAAGAGKGKKLTLILGTKGDPFYITMSCGAKSEAKRLGASLSVQGPKEFQASEQIPIVTSVTAQHPDGVLIAPTDSHALISPMKQMKSAGIKIVEVDTTVTDNSLAVSSISSNNLLGGKIAARTLAKQIGKKGSVVVINEQPGISTTDARAKGFNQAMKAFPNVKVLPVQYDQDNANKAASLVSSILAAHPDLSGIFAINTLTAEGVGTGLRQAGAKGKVKVIGFDASPESVKQLKQGIVQGLIAQEPAKEGKTGVDQAVAALTGKKTTKKIGTKLVAITQHNLSSMQKYLYKSHC
jgi:ribose transport system substrate-binding protein